MNTNPRNQTVQQLLNQGFRIQYSDSEYTLLCRPTTHQCLQIARVDLDGSVNKQPLSTFLNDLLGLPTVEPIIE